MTWTTLAGAVESGARLLTLLSVMAAGVVAVTHWAVRARHLAPFGPLPRAVRRSTDPLLKPIERRLVRWGRNPQDAPLWLLGLTIGLGIILLTLLSWLTGWIEQILWLGQAGPAAWPRFLVGTVTQLMMLAILVRVIASWFGVPSFAGWLRPAVFLTDWLLEPIRRRLPPLGPVDLSPIIAYFALIFIRILLLAVLP